MPSFPFTIKAVILDWAGTTVDHGSRAPARVFVEIFRRRGVAITEAEARGPMGMAKRDHIAAVVRLPRVAELWRAKYGRAPSDGDVQAMYDEFLPLQKTTLATHSDVIPGVPEAIAELRSEGIKIGSTTGYTRELMEVVAPIAARGGYAPDVIICSDDVPAGRPAPWMNFRAAEALGVYPMSHVLVVDDTSVGIQAGVNAGACTVGVMQTGNAMGLSADDLAALPDAVRGNRLTKIGFDFASLGVNGTIGSVARLPAMVRGMQNQSAKR